MLFLICLFVYRAIIYVDYLSLLVHVYLHSSYAGSRYRFWRRLSVCPSAQNLKNYWSEIDVTLYEYVLT